MTKILIDEAVVRQALEALEVVARQPVGKGTVDAIAAIRQALEQPAPAHCEAGPEYCQQCKAEHPAQQEPNIPGLEADPSAFVRWASKNGYDMTCHPLHFRFLNEKTAAARDGWKAAHAFYTAQPAPAHCEAGPEYCQQCCKESFEDRSLALAAAVRYVKNNTPNLVWTEIERALTTPPAPAQQEPVLKVYKGELCYKSKEDDQSFGMWCPVTQDLPFPEGTKFYTPPPAPAHPSVAALIPKPEWANTESDWVVRYLRERSIFDADQIGAMLDFAAAAAAAAQPLTEQVRVPLEVLEAAESSLGSFCSDEGWSDQDMQNMDNLSAYIARHKAAHGITKGTP